jgi:hypothetical protein
MLVGGGCLINKPLTFVVECCDLSYIVDLSHGISRTGVTLTLIEALQFSLHMLGWIASLKDDKIHFISHVLCSFPWERMLTSWGGIELLPTWFLGLWTHRYLMIIANKLYLRYEMIHHWGTVDLSSKDGGDAWHSLNLWFHTGILSLFRSSVGTKCSELLLTL